MKQLKKIENFSENQLDRNFQEEILGGRLETTIQGCVEYTQVSQGQGDMHQQQQNDDGTIISDATIYYPTFPWPFP